MAHSVRTVGVLLGALLGAWACTYDYDTFDTSLGADGAGEGGATGSGLAGDGAGLAGDGSGATGASAKGGAGGESLGGAGAKGGSGASGGGEVGGTGGAGAVSCTEQYGDLVAYLECPSDRTTCKFFYQMGDSLSCEQACGERGGECISAHNDVGGMCSEGGPEPCNNTSHNHAICICSKGCGGGPPCAAGLVCSNGTCLPE